MRENLPGVAQRATATSVYVIGHFLCRRKELTETLARKRAGVPISGNGERQILLRKRKFSDTSLIVSWCTDSLGCIQTMAKGARRAKSGFAGKLDLFYEAEIQIVRSRKSNLHTLTEVVLRNVFAGIRQNYVRTRTAAYFVELIELCTERDHHEPELFTLLQRAFAFLDGNDASLRAISHFEKELARIAGVHDARTELANPASALANLFGKLPITRAPLLRQFSEKTSEPAVTAKQP